MRRRFSFNPPSALLVLASMLLLSGCSMAWVLPVPGLVIVLAGLMLGLVVHPTRGQNEQHNAGRPAVIADVSADQEPAVLETNRTRPASAINTTNSGQTEDISLQPDDYALEGDGLELALAAQMLATALADVNATAKPLVFESQSRATPLPSDQATAQGEAMLAGTDTPTPSTAPQAQAELLSTTVPEPSVITAELSIEGDGWAGENNNGYLLAQDGDMVNPLEGDKEAIARGGITFNTRCGTYCHGGRAIGGGCPSLVDETWLHGDSNTDIFRVIAGGAGEGTRMGAFGGEFTPDEIWEIIAYLRSRHQEYIMEKAGPGSFREQALNCPGESVLTIQSNRGKTYSGHIVIEDLKSITLEDRSKLRPTRRRVLKSRIGTSDLQCVDKS